MLFQIEDKRANETHFDTSGHCPAARTVGHSVSALSGVAPRPCGC
jgi:hypothetical protein